MNKSILKKGLLILMAGICLFMLSGCSFSDLMSKGTGVASDPDFQTWEKLSESGKLDESGKYTPEVIHVSFAGNSFLDVHYYRDAKKKEEFQDGTAYLFPGDKIYVSVKVKDSAEGIYLFDSLKAVEYTKENTRGKELYWPFASDISCLTIPTDYLGTEIAIEPIGHFGERSVSLNGYFPDNTEATGKWYINDKEQTSRTVILNPMDTYNIEYKFDSDKYYLINSVPKAWKSDDASGMVVFELSGAKTGEEKYEVGLDRYLTVEIGVSDGMVVTYKIGDGEPVDMSWSKKCEIPKLKEDSRFTVYTTSNKENNIKFSKEATIEKTVEEVINGQKCYAHKVKLGDENQFIFTPSEYQTEHGKIKFIYNGKEITEKIKPASGNVITVEAAETEEGYWLPDDGKKITINGARTANELRKIRFYPKKTVSVLLDKPLAGGEIKYYANGQELTGQSAQLLCGTKITAQTIAQNGWEAQIESDDEYIVTESNNQTISFNGKNVNDFFRQMESFKPILKVRGNGNLGTNCKVDITAKGYETTGAIAKDINIVTEKGVGTDENVRFKFSSMDFDAENNAVMVFVKKKTADNLEYIEIHYVETANGTAEIAFDNEKQYKEVNVELKAIKGEYFQPEKCEKAEIETYFADIVSDGTIRDELLTADTFIHDDRKISVKIKPVDGYTMIGADTENGIYKKKEIFYRDYKNQIHSVIQNQIKKACHFILNTEDELGKVEYRIDGQIKSGEIDTVVGKKLSIHYQITDDHYIIDYEKVDIWGAMFGWTGVVNNDKSCTIEIEITEDMNDKTISRGDYIKVFKIKRGDD